MNMVPHGIDDLLMSGADHEAKLQHGTGVARNGVGGLSILPDDIASTSSVFQA
jgi:hypothetical protein